MLLLFATHNTTATAAPSAVHQPHRNVQYNVTHTYMLQTPCMRIECVQYTGTVEERTKNRSFGFQKGTKIPKQNTQNNQIGNMRTSVRMKCKNDGILIHVEPMQCYTLRQWMIGKIHVKHKKYGARYTSAAIAVRSYAVES